MFDLDKKTQNRLTLKAIFIFALIITAVIIYLNSTHTFLGHSYRDVYLYLIEAYRMSGGNISGYGFVDYLPPFLPFLTSLLFKLGFISTATIFVTSGLFFFVGIMGLFKLLRLRFSNFYAFFGSFLYGTLFINIKWVANGTLDIAFVAVMIWALYFFIQGMEKNQKYFYLAFPLGVLSFFTKYTGALIFGLMLLYFMSRTNIARNIKKYFKHICGGVIAGIITSIPFFAYFFVNNIPLGFLNQAEEVSSQSSLTVAHGGQLTNDLFFYIKGMLYNTSGTDVYGLAILFITAIGLILTMYMFFNTFKDSFVKIRGRQSSIHKLPVPVNYFYIFLVISLIMVAISFFTAGMFSFVYSELLLFAGMYLLAYSLTKIIIEYDEVDNIWLSTYPYLAMNITMAGLFLSYMVFFSAHLTKADRYFTAMAPGFIFFIVLSVEILLSRIKGFEIKNFNLKYLIPLAMMFLMLLSAVNYLGEIHDDSFALNEIQAADWISDKEGIILSDRGPTYTWLLKKEVPYARFIENDTLLNQNLLNNSATYYIGMEKVNLTNYAPVKEFDGTTIYQLK